MAADPLNSKGGFSTGIPANTIIQANGQVTTNAGANVSGNINLTGNISLGNISNAQSDITVLGGSNGQVLGTDGTGNITFQSRIANGTAAVALAANGNVTIS